MNDDNPQENIDQNFDTLASIFDFDPNESKHRAARGLRFAHKHWTKKATDRKRSKRRSVKNSRRQNR